MRQIIDQAYGHDCMRNSDILGKSYKKQSYMN